MSGDDRPEREQRPDGGYQDSTGNNTDSHRPTSSSDALDRLYADPAWIASHLPSLRRGVLRGLRDKGLDVEQAEDAFAEALVRLFVHLPDRRTPRSVMQWLSLVAYRTGTRSASAWRRSLRAAADTASLSRADDPLAIVEERELWKATLGATTRMNEGKRFALLWVIQRELVAMEAAVEAARLERWLRSTGASETSSRQLRLRARQQLRDRLRHMRALVPAVSLTRVGGARSVDPRALAAGAAAFIGVAAVFSGSVTTAPSRASSEVQVITDAGVVIDSRQTPTADPAGPTLPATGTQVTRGVPRVPSASTTGETTVRTLRHEIPGTGTVVYGTDRPPGATFLVCVHGAPTVGSACVDHPLPRDKRPVL